LLPALDCIVVLLLAIAIQIFGWAHRPIVIGMPDIDPSIHVAHAHMRSATAELTAQVATHEAVLRHRQAKIVVK
jgi:hypothetical protein